MCATASAAAPEAMLLLGVTVLTSTDEASLRETGVAASMEEQVLRLAQLGVDSSIGGLVASPLELAPLRRAYGSKVKIVTPGIRPAGTAKHDQKRAATPSEALSAGADFLVIGRPSHRQPIRARRSSRSWRMLFERLFVLDDQEPRSATLNMAIDEALLESCRRPILRFYRWREPSLSFGYFGKFAEVATQARDRELVRRWTGGGSVPHGEDLTYSLITPASDPVSRRGPPVIYPALHSAIRLALRAEGRETELAKAAAEKVSDACFANPVRDDLLSCDGRKIAGAAQRRTRGRLSASREHSTEWPLGNFPSIDSRAYFPIKSSRMRARRPSLSAPLSWWPKNTARTPGYIAGKLAVCRFDIKSRPSILRL